MKLDSKVLLSYWISAFETFFETRNGIDFYVENLGITLFIRNEK